MSMTEIIDSMMDDRFTQYMNAPEPPDGQAYISYDKNNVPWVTCCFCGKRQFPITKETKIQNLLWICKNSQCKKEININV